MRERLGIGLVAISLHGLMFWRIFLKYDLLTASIVTAIFMGVVGGVWLFMEGPEE